MPLTPHSEKHFTASAAVRDLVIGMSDGLTVPFALAAGLSGVVGSNSVIITAGLAEIAAGSIAMGLGGYLAGRSDAEHYASEKERERLEIIHKTHAEIREVEEVFERYGLSAEEIAPITNALQARPESWIDFMMRFELGLEEPDPERARRSALTIAGAYIVGGFIPLSPYFIFQDAPSALILSVFLTLAALLVFGYVKGHFTGSRPLRSAFQTAFVGGAAAAAAFGLAKLFTA